MADRDMEVDPSVEELYMPSRWGVRVPPEAAVGLHVRVTRQESDRVRREEPGRLGVRYGAEPGDWLDLYNESAPSGRLLAYLSGGYWQELSGELSSYPVSPLVAEGHAVAVINYTRAPGQDMAGIIRQVERAGAWLVRWAEEQGAEVWVAGHSAGSHLAAMLVSSAWYSALAPAAARRLAGVIHLSGVFRLEPLLRTSVSTPELGLAGAAPWASPASGDNVARVAGAGRHLITMLVVGQHDSPAFKEQAEEYGLLLEGAGLRVVRREQPGEDHFSLVERLADRQYGLTGDILRLLAGAYSV